MLLVDISLINENGLEIAKYIKNVNPMLKVILLSSHKEGFYVVNALEAGVDGYIHKDSDPEELIEGIHKVLQGEKFFSSEISGMLINNIYKRPQHGHPFLTKTEKRRSFNTECFLQASTDTFYTACGLKPTISQPLHFNSCRKCDEALATCLGNWNI